MILKIRILSELMQGYPTIKYFVYALGFAMFIYYLAFYKYKQPKKNTPDSHGDENL